MTDLTIKTLSDADNAATSALKAVFAAYPHREAAKVDADAVAADIEAAGFADKAAELRRLTASIVVNGI